MSTNFYLRKKIITEEKNTLIDMINNDQFDKAASYLTELTDSIHIGKRSAGWKFRFECHNFKYFNPSKRSFIEWLDSGVIVDEYNRTYTTEEFFKDNESFINDKDGYDLKKYYTEGRETDYFKTSRDRQLAHFKKSCPNIDINEYAEFYMDGMRFTIETDWC